MGREIVTKKDVEQALVVVDEAKRREQEWMDVVTRSFAKGCDPDEVALFLQTAKRTGLDPTARQIYAIKRYDSRQGRDVMAIQVSIDGFRAIAERTGQYAGQKGPEWCGKDGAWTDVWLKDELPAAARVGVIRKDFREPLYAVALWKDYYVTDSKGNLGPMWAKMPTVMLAKCAESLALRRAFPADLSGLYTTDEMGSANRQNNSQIIDVIDGVGPVVLTADESRDWRNATRKDAKEDERMSFITEVKALGITSMPALNKLLGVSELPQDVPFGELINQAREKLGDKK